MALDFTPNKMRNCGIWSMTVWSLTAEGVPLEPVLRNVGSMGQSQWGERVCPIRGCYNKTGEKPGSLNHYDGCQRWRGVVKLCLWQGSL